MSRNCVRTGGNAGISVKRILWSALLGAAISFFLTLGASLLLQREVLPLTSSCWLGPVIVAISAFITGWISSKNREKKMLCGLLSAIVYGLLLVICGMVLFSAPMQAQRMTLSAAALVGGCLGGIVLSAARA